MTDHPHIITILPDIADNRAEWEVKPHQPWGGRAACDVRLQPRARPRRRPAHLPAAAAAGPDVVAQEKPPAPPLCGAELNCELIWPLVVGLGARSRFKSVTAVQRRGILNRCGEQLAHRRRQTLASEREADDNANGQRVPPSVPPTTNLLFSLDHPSPVPHHSSPPRLHSSTLLRR